MPALPRSAWYDLTRDMNWTLSYVDEDRAFPQDVSNTYGVPTEAWWEWDEPYKITYPEYVHNQAGKDAAVYAVNQVAARSHVYERLDPGWRAAVLAHYGVTPLSEYLGAIAEGRMARFGRSAAWRNMAVFGTLDEIRHAQIQAYFAYSLLGREPRADWAHRTFHTQHWGAIAARAAFDDTFGGNDAVSTAIQLTFALETGFSNLQFLGMAAEALEVGDLEFAALISSIQTDEARHAQQGEPTIKVLLKAGRKDVVQELVDVAFWRVWRIFALLTGMSMDYYTPLEHRSQSFKEFMNEWIVKQFREQFRDLGLELPWYWNDHFLPELDWFHHTAQIGVWYLRSTMWWNPHAGVSPAERAWLEEKYPGWGENYGLMWDQLATCLREGREIPTALPTLCHTCNLPLTNPAGHRAGTLDSPEPLTAEHAGRRYFFCSAPCRWIFSLRPERYAGHVDFTERFVAGDVQPATLEGALAYMGLTPAEYGDDSVGYAWIFDRKEP
ncbi:YHS domain-containing protein [Streptomyces sp. NPDC021012]|uniref:YHS domain-containing protein n=1 Tax=Streptomyces sp. NPDC021012 TaxID=3365107 RepID=UPI0037AC70BE